MVTYCKAQFLNWFSPSVTLSPRHIHSSMPIQDICRQNPLLIVLLHECPRRRQDTDLASLEAFLPLLLFHTKKSTSFNSMDPYPLLSFPSGQDFPLFPRRFFFQKRKERKEEELFLASSHECQVSAREGFPLLLLVPFTPHPSLEATSKQKERERGKKVAFRISYDLPLLSLLS